MQFDSRADLLEWAKDAYSPVDYGIKGNTMWMVLGFGQGRYIASLSMFKWGPKWRSYLREETNSAAALGCPERLIAQVGKPLNRTSRLWRSANKWYNDQMKNFGSGTYFERNGHGYVLEGRADPHSDKDWVACRVPGGLPMFVNKRVVVQSLLEEAQRKAEYGG